MITYKFATISEIDQLVELIILMQTEVNNILPEKISLIMPRM